MNKKILVTGGAGYIGSHTCKALAESGYEPVVYDSLVSGHRDFVKWGPLIVGDLHDTTRLAHLLSTVRPLAVLHFAAFKSVGESVHRPLKYYQNNLGGTLSLLDAMQRSGINRIVFSSSCATYGTPSEQPITERTAQEPINPYGRSKYFVERVLEDLYAARQLSYITLRYFNAAGADHAGEIGSRDFPQTHLIPLAIDAAFGGEPLKILGRDFSTHDGTAVRDCIHVEDLARAHMLALKRLLEQEFVSESFNLGTGVGSSVFEVIQGLKDIGCEPKVTDCEKRAGDPAYLVADTTRAQMLLNWEPLYPRLEDMLRTALVWYQKDRIQRREAVEPAL